MNKCTIIGNLTRDPEARTTSTGKDVCTFTVAVNRKQRQGEAEQADFFQVSVFGTMSAPCAKYLVKGRKVCVVGPVSVDTYTGHDGKERAQLRIFAQDVEFVSPPKENAEQAVPEGFIPVDDNDLPF